MLNAESEEMVWDSGVKDTGENACVMNQPLKNNTGLNTEKGINGLYSSCPPYTEYCSLKKL